MIVLMSFKCYLSIYRFITTLITCSNGVTSPLLHCPLLLPPHYPQCSLIWSTLNWSTSSCVCRNERRLVHLQRQRSARPPERARFAQHASPAHHHRGVMVEGGGAQAGHSQITRIVSKNRRCKMSDLSFFQLKNKRGGKIDKKGEKGRSLFLGRGNKKTSKRLFSDPWVTCLHGRVSVIRMEQLEHHPPHHNMWSFSSSPDVPLLSGHQTFMRSSHDVFSGRQLKAEWEPTGSHEDVLCTSCFYFLSSGRTRLDVLKETFDTFPFFKGSFDLRAWNFVFNFQNELKSACFLSQPDVKPETRR